MVTGMTPALPRPFSIGRRAYLNSLCSAIILYDPLATFERRPHPKCAILSRMPKLDSLSNLLLTIFDLCLDAVRLVRLSLRRRCALAAENLFLRKQLALYLEHQVKPRRAKAPTRLTPVLLSGYLRGERL